MSERCSSLRKSCEQCKRFQYACDSKRPCSHCTEIKQECVYSVVPENSRSVFSTQAARRLSSGSACETCRRRKTKCDGGSPCSFCAANNLSCCNNFKRKGSKKQSVETIVKIEDRLSRIEELMTVFTPATDNNMSTSPPNNRFSSQAQAQAAEEKSRLESMTIRRGSSSYNNPPAAIMRPSNSHKSIANSMLNLSISSSSSLSTNNNSLPHPLASVSTPPFWSLASKSATVTSNNTTTNTTATTTNNNDNNTINAFNAFNDTNNNAPPTLFKMETIAEQRHYLPSPPNSARSMTNEWKSPGEIPSFMDQLSNRTFANSGVDYTTTNFPIYPITPPPSQSCQPLSPNNCL